LFCVREEKKKKKKKEAYFPYKAQSGKEKREIDCRWGQEEGARLAGDESVSVRVLRERGGKKRRKT